jgi:hypothetical protein
VPPGFLLGFSEAGISFLYDVFGFGISSSSWHFRLRVAVGPLGSFFFGGIVIWLKGN